MISPEARRLGAELSAIALRVDKAQQEVVALARTLVMALEDAKQPSLAQELGRRIFVVDSETAAVSELLKTKGAMVAFMELMLSRGRQ